MSDAIATRLRAMILDGRLPAGGRINEVHLATQLGVSRTPLREALSSLVSEGAVTIEPRKGFFTAPLTAEELEQLYAIRPILDPEALRLAGIPAPARLRELRALNRHLEKERAPERIIELDDKWHFELVAACPNRTLLDLIKQITRRTKRYELAVMRERINVERAVDQHKAIIAALDASRLALACRELKRNMQNGTAPILEWLRERERKAETKEKSGSFKSREGRSVLKTVILLAALLCMQWTRANQAAPTLRDLEGLWKSTLSFGPDLRGPVVVVRHRDYGYLRRSQQYPYRDGKVRVFYTAGNVTSRHGRARASTHDWFPGRHYNDEVLYIPQRRYIPNYLLPAVLPELKRMHRHQRMAKDRITT